MNYAFHHLSAQAVLKQLSSEEGGLSHEEAQKRLKEYGLNELPQPKKPSVVWIFIKQLRSALIYILLAAAILSFAVGHTFDAYAILLVIAINSVFSFFYERRAEKSIEKLRALTVPYATVIRGKSLHKIESRFVVPGDILVIEAGDRVAADGRLIESNDLTTNEAVLTGESLPIQKTTEPLPASLNLADQTNIVWMGTTALNGRAYAVVTATGVKTAFGRIAQNLQLIKRERTPFGQGVNGLGKKLSLIAIFVSIAIVVLGLWRGFGIFELFLFSVAAAVSAIPEGLPVVLVIVLAIGVDRMAKRNAIIRYLPAVETLGVADIICTDKTGTLTENKMVARVVATAHETIEVTGSGWSPKGEFIKNGEKTAPRDDAALARLLKISAVCNHAELQTRDENFDIIGDPTEGALVVLAAKAGLQKSLLNVEEPIIDEVPFTSERKFRAMLIKTAAGSAIIAIGAPEVIYSRASGVAVKDAAHNFTEEYKKLFEKKQHELAEKAMRVLAVAWRELPKQKTELQEKDISSLTLLGLVGITDPPRANVKEAIATAKLAGVRVIMATGDHRTTAIAVAREIGLLKEEDIESDMVLTESDISQMNDEDFLKTLKKAAIFARITPESKLRIVDGLKKLGHIVAMTGDGVNDAPALKKADIGIAMGITGTDVSREVSDIVLADDNFISIVNAIEEGRIAFRNVQQTTGFLVMTNMGESVTLITALLAGLPLPLLPAQILWLNLVTDGFTDVSLATEGGHKDVMNLPPRKQRTKIITREIITLTAVMALLMSVGTLWLYTSALKGRTIDEARTVAFTAMALFQLWNVFNMRSLRYSIFSIGAFSNRFVTAGVAASFLLHLSAMYVPKLREIFKLVPLGFEDWTYAIIISSSILWLMEIYKFLRRKKIKLFLKKI